MTDGERLARAHRAKSAMEEFVSPILSDIRATYSARIVEIANTELNPAKRAEKLTALSNAIRIAEQLESGIGAIILDGDLAAREKLRTEKMERMTAPQRRLMGLAPAR